ncbi:MAG TPA: CopG family transcriptional regulator [Candidatus Sulfomarinibacteraceae bacterium]|nr:CopG family transcriptional regulator [Candidatus Sulfomarinibacteraceae bacterium]
MRTTVTLPDDVHAAVKALADSSGRPMSEVVSELIRRALEPAAEVETIDGLPVFTVAARSEMIPGSRASELLAEEGVE